MAAFEEENNASTFISEDFIRALREVAEAFMRWWIIGDPMVGELEKESINKKKIAQKIYKKAYKYNLNKTFGLAPHLWETAASLVDECKRVFFRLTSKQDGTLVPLWDLIDEWPMYKENGKGEIDKNAAHTIICEVFRLTCERATPPVPYDPVNAVFTKTSETFDAIQQLMRGFIEWEENGEKTE